ncbi:MAG: hypothetical protein IT550_04640 [Novosphingobium sp.]|nr:hypothetical protein [Novosphingobium sp.]
MTIRTTIILLTAPLFLMLAVVNGALLYFQERAEMARALDTQALSAAVTTAEFLAWPGNAERLLADPVRRKGLAAAAARIAGLDGLYLVRANTPPLALVPARRALAAVPARAPDRPIALPMAQAAPGARQVVALAPAGPGAYVLAAIDAEPLFARIERIKRIVLLIALAGGLIAALLAWLVARRIVRELDANARALAAIDGAGPVPDGGDLAIREARDLASAVRLMDASARAAELRDRRLALRRDQARSPQGALDGWRQDRFGPCERDLGGRRIATRLLGDAAPGCFIALASDAHRAAVVLGRCTGETPAQALANALAAKRYLEATLMTADPAECPAAECLAIARRAFALVEERTLAWTRADAATAPRLLALADPATEAAAAIHAGQHAGASPHELIESFAVLIAPAGVFAAIGPA